MQVIIRRVPRRWREGWFLALLAVAGLAIAGNVASRLGSDTPRPQATHRPVDPARLREKLLDGTIVEHEAEFYRPAEGGGR